MSKGRGHFRVNIAALVSDARPFQYVVIHVDLESALVVDQGHKTCQVARIKLAGMSWDRRRQIQWSKNRYAVMLHVLTSFCVSHVAAGGSREVYNHGSRMHVVHGFFCEHQRRF